MHIYGRHVDQFSKKNVNLGQDFYGNIHKEGDTIVIRIDDKLHPEFWMEILIEDKDLCEKEEK